MKTPLRHLVIVTSLSATRLAAAQTDTYDEPAAAPDYDAAMSAAARDEAAGHAGEAAAALDPLAHVYPDDHALALRLGWLWFSAHEYARAQAHYQRAVTLSAGESHDATLGLAWTAQRLGDRASAQRAFATVLAAEPGNASAREGAALAAVVPYVPRPVRVWASLFTGAQFYQGHPTRNVSFSVSPSVVAQLYDLVLVGATYRFVDYDRATMQGGRPMPPSRYTQHELHGVVGITRRDYSVRLHLGHVWDTSSTIAPATVFGLSGRLALRGDLTGELSVTSFADYAIARLAAAWSATLSTAWSVGPSLSAQYGDGAFGGAVGAQALWTRDGYSASASVRVGDERRPTSLNESLTYATNDHIRATASVAGQAPLGRGISLVLRYDWLRLVTSANTGSVDANAHFVTAGLVGGW